MKKLLALFLGLSATVWMISCSDEDTPDPVAGPSVGTPSPVDVQVGGDVNVTFAVTAEGGYASATVAATGGTAAINSEPEAGATSGNVVVTFTADNNAGAGSVTLTVTDENGETDQNTGVINKTTDATPPQVTAPAPAEVQELSSVDVTFAITANSGYASSAITATNGEASITSEPDAGATSGDVVVSFTGAAAGAGSVVLTVTDANGATDEGTAVINVTPIEPILVSLNIDENTTWTTGNTYILGGRIAVDSGATLTIEPGVVIKGQPGTAGNAKALLVARGAKLMAVGTAELPIIFTSIEDDITPAMVAAGQLESPNLDPNVNGLWGGVIVCGYAGISASNDDGDVTEAQIEGIPTSDTNGLYGGNDDADDSGEIAYISIRHGGTNIGSGNEINGLTLGGVGSGTSISNVEIVANQDDGIEWFGGTVDMDGVVVWNCGDDGLDTDQDWVGTCSNFIIVTPVGGSGFEMDGPEGSTSRGTNHTFHNGTVYAGTDIDHLVDWDGSTNAVLTDIYFYGIDATIIGDGTFEPIESFEGSATGLSMNWETTNADGLTLAQVFTDGSDAITTEVAANANTVGQDSEGFGWTWADVSGALAGIGL